MRSTPPEVRSEKLQSERGRGRGRGHGIPKKLPEPRQIAPNAAESASVDWPGATRTQLHSAPNLVGLDLSKLKCCSSGFP